MQARWGTHGDHPAIVLAASNVADMYRLTMAAVRFAQRFRTPVILLADQMVGQMRESFSPELVGRYRLTSGDFDFTPDLHPSRPGARGASPARAGLGRAIRTSPGSSTTRPGFPTNDPEKSDEFLRELYNKVAHHRNELCLYDVKNEGKGRVCIVAYGSCARTARAAWKLAEQEGLPVEVLHLYTLFPLPVEIVQQVARRVEFMLIPELNLGQYAHEVRKMAEQLDHGHRHGQDRRHPVHPARDPRPHRRAHRQVRKRVADASRDRRIPPHRAAAPHLVPGLRHRHGHRRLPAGRRRSGSRAREHRGGERHRLLQPGLPTTSTWARCTPSTGGRWPWPPASRWPGPTSPWSCSPATATAPPSAATISSMPAGATSTSPASSSTTRSTA